MEITLVLLIPIAIFLFIYFQGRPYAKNIKALLAIFPEGKFRNWLFFVSFTAFYNHHKFKLIAWWQKENFIYIHFYSNSKYSFKARNAGETKFDKFHLLPKVKTNNPAFDNNYILRTNRFSEVNPVSRAISSSKVQESIASILDDKSQIRITRTASEVVKIKCEITPEELKATLHHLEFIIKSLSQEEESMSIHT